MGIGLGPIKPGQGPRGPVPCTSNLILTLCRVKTDYTFKTASIDSTFSYKENLKLHT